MYLKGAVIMKNINLQKQSSLSYSHFIHNHNQIESIANYNKILQNRINVFSEMIKESYPNILNFFMNYLKSKENYNENTLALIVEFLHDYKNIEKKGTPILDNLCNVINQKKIAKESYELLIEILEHQESITKEILKKKITFERIEIILNHLRDLPLYIRTDLELETLPDSKQINIYFKPTNNSMQKIKTDYDPFKKEIA